MDKSLIVIDNSLVTSAYNLTLNEQRLIYCALKQMPKGVPIDPKTPFFITRDDFIELGANPNVVAREIRQATRDLMRKSVKLLNPMGEIEIPWLYEVLRFDKRAEEKLRERYPNPEDYVLYINHLRARNLLDSLPFNKNDDDNIVARVIFHEKMMPLLSDLRESFTQILTADIAEFGSVYTFRIYQLLMQYKTTGYVNISLDDLRFMLMLQEKYPLVADLRKRVIDVAIKEINEKSPYKVRHEMIKKGRKFVALELKFKLKDKPKSLEQEPTKDKRQIDMFTGLTDQEQAIIQARIDEYIQRLESEGETVSDWHKKNIAKKAAAEKWGLDVFEKKQVKQEQKAKASAAKKAEQERQEQKKQQDQQRQQALIETFESLPPEQQEFILDEVGRQAKGIFIDFFKRDRANNRVHKNPMFMSYFMDLLGLND